MKITVFTSNQPRHVSLISALAQVADEVFAVQECATVFPGRVDDFYRKSDVMQDYFLRVISAEEEIFGGVHFVPSNVRTLSLKSGDLNGVGMDLLAPALRSDIYVVFGSSYIKGPLIDFLISQSAVNIHMGVSPYYRGSSCNFWAMFDGNADLVGSTIHLLSRGLDSGSILFHALPEPSPCDPFLLGMRAVKAAHISLVEEISKGTILSHGPVVQDKSNEIRYTRHSDFTDTVAREYLDRQIDKSTIGELLKFHPPRELIRPRFM